MHDHDIEKILFWKNCYCLLQKVVPKPVGDKTCLGLSVGFTVMEIQNVCLCVKKSKFVLETWKMNICGKTYTGNREHCEKKENTLNHNFKLKTIFNNNNDNTFKNSNNYKN